MSFNSVLLLIAAFYAVGAIAEPVASEPQSRTWKEKLPGGGRFEHLDRYVDYKREGKVVFRTIARTTTFISANDKKVDEFPEQVLELAVDRKVIASIKLDKANATGWSIISTAPLYFSSAGVPVLDGNGRRFFHLLVPQYDYYEYLEISGTEVKLLPQTKESYTATKRGLSKLVEKGYIHELGQEPAE